MQSQLEQVIELPRGRLQEAVGVASRAFYEYPTTIHMMPEEEERKRKIGYGFEVIIKYGLRYGIVHATSPNIEGIAVWLPPEKVHMTAWGMLRNGGFKAFRKSGIKIMKRGMPIFNYIAPAHKKNAPFDHWYLQCLAVDPDHQKKGYGGILLQRMLKLIDEKGLPAYLETNKENNVGFYERHGFEVVEYAIIHNTEVPNWCMLRRAQ